MPLYQSIQTFNQSGHSLGAVFVFLVGCIDAAPIVLGRQHIKYDILLVHTTNVPHQRVADQGSGSALLHIGVKGSQPIQLKKHLWAEACFLEDGIGLLAGVIVPIH